MKKSILLFSMLSLAFASCTSDDNAPLTGGEKEPEQEVVKPVETATVKANVGGPNQPNQVYIDLSTNQQTTIKRDTWDLGFSSGSDFRVIINGSVKMAVKQLDTNDIDAVQQEDATVAVGYTTLSTLGYVDDPTGKLTGAGNGEGTAIAEVSATATNNKVYLVNLGFEVGNTAPSVGSVALDGGARGWMKIRVTRNGNDYVLDYAKINETTHKTITVSKANDYNFTYVSLTSGSKVNVQPKKANWDLVFTGFTNYYPSGNSNITYYFADYIATNMLGGTKVYMQQTTAETLANDFNNFTKANVDDSKFSTSASDQRVVGDTWRVGGGPSTKPSIKDDRFYVIKDVDGNYYKLKFLALTNDAGERGNPVFEYELLK